MPSKLQNKSAAGSATGADSRESGNNVAVKDKPTIRLHLWLETDEGVFFGAGRAFLLQKIEEHGSLRKAAEDLGMSYRAAWGKIRKTEKVLGVKLIAQCRSKKEGHKLTEEGLLLMEKYLQWFREVEGEALKKAGEIFPWPVHGYKQKDKGRLLQLMIALSASLGPMEALIKSVV